MILDTLTQFASGVALNTGAAGKYLVGDQIDLGNARDIGQGQPLFLVINMHTTATSGGSATCAFTLASDAQAAITVNGTETTHLTTRAFPVASMTAGANIATIILPLEGVIYERFVGLIQTTATAAFTAGKIDAFLTPTPARWKAYPDGNN